LAIRSSQSLLKLGQYFSPQGVALQGAQQLSKKSSKLSIEMYGYDFVGLIIKLVIYFIAAFFIAKVMESIIFARGSVVTIANFLGFKIPKNEQIPQQVKDLFVDGFNGFTYWDIVKVVAILLVVVEFVRYADINSKSGGKPSPMTIGIFLLIGLGLSVITIPEIVAKFKLKVFNKEALV